MDYNLKSLENYHDFILNKNKVRSFLTSDLISVGNTGICLVPEWICESITISIKNAKWMPIYYKVKVTNENISPFSLDENDLKQLIFHYSLSQYPIVVIFAFACGYYDNKVISLIEFIRSENLNITIILDLSQSYGLIDYSLLIKKSDITYFSFNGNKLISANGALRITKDNISDYEKMQPIFDQLGKKQLNSANIIFKEIINNLISDKNHWLSIKETLNPRSNGHRTIILNLTEDEKKSLSLLGYGQYMHPKPQGNSYFCSKSYIYNSRKSFLIFNKRRSI